MDSMKEYNGFSLRQNKVILHYGRMERKQDIRFFNSDEEAKEFYRQVTIGSRRRPIGIMLKQLFCQHDTNKLSGYNGENTFYEYCSNCGKAYYQDNRTEEELIEQQKKNAKRFLASDIRELREKKLALENKLLNTQLLLKQYEEDYENKYGEKA